MKLGAEPKKVALLGAILVLGAATVWYVNSDDAPGAGSSAVQRPAAAGVTPAPSATHPRARRRQTQRSNDRSVLKMQEVTLEAQRGDIDPTLRLDLLQHLKTVPLKGAHRNLFEAGPAPLSPQAVAALHKVKIVPAPVVAHPLNAGNVPAMGAQVAPIPLKFFGFAAPPNAGAARRGFFLEEDNVVVANEGETVRGRFHIISLQPKSAVVEDLVTKNRQTLSIVPELAPNGF